MSGVLQVRVAASWKKPQGPPAESLDYEILASDLMARCTLACSLLSSILVLANDSEPVTVSSHRKRSAHHSPSFVSDLLIIIRYLLKVDFKQRAVQY